MKKTILFVLTLALLLSLTACGDFVSILPGTDTAPAAAAPSSVEEALAGDDFTERPLFSFVGWDAFGESYYTDTPLALSYQPKTADGAQGCRSYVFDRASIIAACDAIRSMTVKGRSPEEPVTSAEYTLTKADGLEYRLTFGVLADGVTRVLSTYTGDYLLEGGAGLWSIVFPAYSPEFDVFDLYFSPDVRAFADNFYSDLPVSVGFRMNSGATITTDDPQTVQAAFQALASASVIVVENNPDQNVDLNQIREYIFTMADGRTYSFRFAQRCLAVTANPAFGPVYYWIDGVDALWSVNIAQENTVGRFEGGTVAQLREDIQTTADVVSGAVADVSVVGVFVDYSIGEEKGYLTLDGDTAYSFLRQMCAVGVTSDTAESPMGDTFTVSVTLSDGTGPILYFTGDTVQQMVGISYVCGSEDMSALRSYILDLAAAGNNTAEVSEGTTD